MSTASLRVWTQSPERFFETGFSKIAQTRMKGLPVNNPRLCVRAFGFERIGNDWMGCVVTPWSILVVLACGNRSTWQHVPTTKVRRVDLLSGEYEFIGMNDSILGEYQACSLMSPLSELPDQRTAEAIAQHAWWLMRQPQTTEPSSSEELVLRLDSGVKHSVDALSQSRRDFLKGNQS